MTGPRSTGVKVGRGELAKERMNSVDLGWIRTGRISNRGVRGEAEERLREVVKKCGGNEFAWGIGCEDGVKRDFGRVV